MAACLKTRWDNQTDTCLLENNCFVRRRGCPDRQNSLSAAFVKDLLNAAWPALNEPAD